MSSTPNVRDPERSFAVGLSLSPARRRALLSALGRLSGTTMQADERAALDALKRELLLAPLE